MFILESNILVRDVMTRNVKVVREDTTLHEIVATMSKFDIDAVIVLEGKKPTGIITTKDALIRGFEHGLPLGSLTAKNVFSSPLKTVDEQETIEEAAEKMRQAKIKHLPVTNKGRLVGMLTDWDIVFAVPSMLSAMEEVCRPAKKIQV